MSDKTYNGWSNYETWNYALWLDNEEYSYRHWTARAQELVEDEDGDKEAATYTLAKELEAELKGDNCPELAGVYGDLLGAALSEVNCYEIAEHYTADVEWEAPEDEPEEPEPAEDDIESE